MEYSRAGKQFFFVSLGVAERRPVLSRLIDEKSRPDPRKARGRWRCRDGRILWDDAALANEFENFRRDPQP